MAITPKQFRAIDWLAKRDNLTVVAPSPTPIIIFRQADGTEVRHNVADIVLWYEARRAEAKRQEKQEKSNN